MEAAPFAQDLPRHPVVIASAQVGDPGRIQAPEQAPRAFGGPAGAGAMLEVIGDLRGSERDHLYPGCICHDERQAVEMERIHRPFGIAVHAGTVALRGPRDMCAAPREEVWQRTTISDVSL